MASNVDSLVGTAVAAERHGNGAVAANLGGERGPSRQRRRTTDDGIRTEHSFGQIRDMHRAAFAFAQAVSPAIDLVHHPLHLAALGDAMAMTPMGRADLVGIGQVHADADCVAFLTSVEMDEARELAGFEFTFDPILK